MLTPTCPNVTHTFHPFGDTPARCLTENIPPDRKGEEKPVNILLLGSGDVRNVLFTAHSDMKRQLDITCCDVDPLVIARNILLLTLIIESDFEDDPNSETPHTRLTDDDLFAIYYHQHISGRLSELVRSQAMGLRLIGSTMSTWNETPFGWGQGFPPCPCSPRYDRCGKETMGKGKGKTTTGDDISRIRFTDSGSLELLTHIWEAWACDPHSEEQKVLTEDFFLRLAAALYKREEEQVGTPHVPSRAAACSFRAAMPVGLEATFHATMANEDFWRWGTTGTKQWVTDEEADDESTATDPDLEETIKQKKKRAKGKGKQKAKEVPAESSKQARQRGQKTEKKRSDDSGIPSGFINPLFTTPSPGYRIHHSADPLQGFHLAPAYLPIVGQPLPQEGTCQVDRLAAVARQEFSDWCDSFRRAWRKGRISLRFVVSDALAFTHTLQHYKSGALGNPADNAFGNWYRFRDSFNPLVLDSDEYRQAVPSESHMRRFSAPVAFDVIDTSSLADDVGPLNLLIATSPLLKNRLAATLYTEHTLPLPRCVSSDDPCQGPKSSQEVADSLLHGDLATMSVLLGLSPVEYYTNTSTFAPAPTFSSPSSDPPPPPPTPSASGASDATCQSNSPPTAVYFNQRLTWKRPVCHHPTSGTGKEWTISSYYDSWPGPSPSLREEMDHFASEYQKSEETHRDLIEPVQTLVALEAREREEEEERRRAESQKKGKGKGKGKGKEKGKEKAKNPPPQKTAASTSAASTANEATIPGLEQFRKLAPEVRKQVLDARKGQEEALKKWETELRGRFRDEEARWERERTEMPLPHIGFEAEELAEFLMQVYSRMYESKYLFERKDDGKDDGAGAGNPGASAAGADGNASSRFGCGFKLLNPSTYNRATFAALLKMIQARVVLVGEPPVLSPNQSEAESGVCFDETWKSRSSDDPGTDSEKGTDDSVEETIVWRTTLGVMLESLQHSVTNHVEPKGSFDQELSTILHHFGVYSSPDHVITDPEDGQIKPRVYNLAQEATPDSSKHHSPSLYNWVNIPSTLGVTIRIPRHRLNVLQLILKTLETGVDVTGGRTKQSSYIPALQACIRPTPDGEGKAVADNMPGHWFTSLQTGFGEVETAGRPFTPLFRLDIETDPLGWEGQSDFFVSFMAPTSILIRGGMTGLVSVEMVPSLGPDVARRNELSFLATTGSLKGMDLKIFDANLGLDSSGVYISQHMPNQSGVTRMCGFAEEILQS